jgi:hypothetical protein
LVELAVQVAGEPDSAGLGLAGDEGSVIEARGTRVLLSAS